MDSTQRSEFDGHMAALFGAWGRNYSPGLQEGYAKGLAKMHLSELVRVIDRSLERFSEHPEMKLPTVGDLWATKRSLRATAPPPAAAPEPSMDGWTVQSNLHLAHYLRARNRPGRYAPDSACSLQLTPQIGPETAARTGLLVEWKNAWARDMREAAAEHEIPPDGGKGWWEDCMRRCEAAIDRSMQPTTNHSGDAHHAGPIQTQL